MTPRPHARRRSGRDRPLGRVARPVAVASLAGALALAPLFSTPAAATPAAAAAQSAPADPTACRAIRVEADGPIRSGVARQTFGVDGSGVTVGIISDSFAAAVDPASTPAQDVATGALPGPGNPCGRTRPVEVIRDNAEGSDEGRAMAQIVHGIAPGARLLFVAPDLDAPDLATSLAGAIDLMAASGADVIVDDFRPDDGPLFQRDEVGDAVERARAQHGVVYLTSAGNSTNVGAPGTASEGRPISSWSTPAYRPTACPAWLVLEPGSTAADCLDFSPDATGDPTNTLEFGGSADPSSWQFALYWGEPVGAVRSAFLPQLYRVEAGSDPALATVSGVDEDGLPRADIQPDGGDTLPGGTYELVVVRTATGDPAPDGAEPAITWSANTARDTILRAMEYDRSAGPDTVGPTVIGHAADGTALAVGAADWAAPDRPRSYSSIGPVTLLFEPVGPAGAPPAAPLPAPLRPPSPAVTGVDGMRTTFFGRVSTEEGQTVYRFRGTSAAAPSAAGVVALALEHRPGTTQPELAALLATTSAPMTNPYAAFGFSDGQVFGAGRIDALALLTALGPPAPGPGPAPAAGPADPDDTPVLAASGGPDAFAAAALAGAALVAGAGALLLGRDRRVRRPGRRAGRG